MSLSSAVGAFRQEDQILRLKYNGPNREAMIMMKKTAESPIFNIYIFLSPSATFSRDVAASSGSPKTNQQGRIRSIHQSYGLIYNRRVRLKLLVFDIL